MNYHQAKELLTAFSKKYVGLTKEINVFKIAVEELDNSVFGINIYHNKDTALKDLKELYDVSETFPYKLKEMHKSNYKVSFKVGNRIIGQSVEVGASINPVGSTRWGTLGWGFKLFGKAFAVSNWHVLCAEGNATIMNRRIQVYSIASRTFEDVLGLHFFERVSDVSDNRWDLAIAKFDNPTDVNLLFQTCDGLGTGTRSSYPSYVQSSSPVLGTSVSKVGATTPICNTGTFNGVANINVDLDHLTPPIIRRFINQLQFTPLTKPGDSGSLIVNSSSNEIIGLNFAGDEDDHHRVVHTYANPIFLHPFFMCFRRDREKSFLALLRCFWIRFNFYLKSSPKR